jgi:hypothetical protein
MLEPIRSVRDARRLDGLEGVYDGLALPALNSFGFRTLRRAGNT